MQLSIFDGTEQFQIDKPIRLIELFAGIGAQAAALRNLGVDFEHYRICEYDKFAVQSYNAIHGTSFKTSDITQMKGADLGIVDTDKYCYILTYSFPCTDLSQAGKMQGLEKGSGTRSGLLWEVERLLSECKELPQVLLMENVPQVLKANGWWQWVEFLDKLGYKNRHQILNAKDYGIPQNRERAFMVSLLGDYFYCFPDKQKLTKRLKDMLEPEPVDKKYYLSQKQIDSILHSTFKQEESRIQDNKEICGTLLARDWKSPKCVEVENETVKEGGFVAGKSKNYQPGILPNFSRTIDTEGQNGVYISNDEIKLKHVETLSGGVWDRIHESNRRVYADNGLSPTVTTCCGGNTEPKVKTNEVIRKLTPKECWRLMGFNDGDFDRAKASGISNSQLYKQAGNSIVVKVLEAIFGTMIKKEIKK